MSKLQDVPNKDLLIEFSCRVNDGRLDIPTVMSLIRMMLDKKESEKQFQKEKAMNTEIALIAALSGRTRKYGNLTRLEFIAEKLSPYRGKFHMLVDEMVDKMLGQGKS